MKYFNLLKFSQSFIFKNKTMKLKDLKKIPSFSHSLLSSKFFIKLLNFLPCSIFQNCE